MTNDSTNGHNNTLPLNSASTTENDNVSIDNLSPREAYFMYLTKWRQEAEKFHQCTQYIIFLLAMYESMLTQTATLNRNGSNSYNLQNTITLTPNVIRNLRPHHFYRRRRHESHLRHQMISFFRRLPDNQQSFLVHRFGGFKYQIATFWKRAVAQVIDMFIWYFIKIITIIIIVNVFEIKVEVNNYTGLYKAMLRQSDLSRFFKLLVQFMVASYKIILLDIVSKLAYSAYEASWTSTYEATPGKLIMGIKILYVEAVLPLEIPRVEIPEFLLPLLTVFSHQHILIQSQIGSIPSLVFPGANPSFYRVFLRAFLKNMSLTIIYPICFFFTYLKYNRTIIDVCTKTIVVEDLHAPFVKLQRQEQQLQQLQMQ